MKTLQKLKVLADPEWKGKHPYHDNRFIVTKDAEFDFQDRIDASHGWFLAKGSKIATITDCQGQKEYARLFAAAPELLQALQHLLELVDHMNHPTHPSNERWPIEQARSAIAKAIGD